MFQNNAKNKKYMGILHCNRNISTWMITLKNCAKYSELLLNSEKMSTFHIINLCNKSVFIPLNFSKRKKVKC